MIFPLIPLNALFVSLSGRISFTVAPARLKKISPSFYFLAKAIAATRFMTMVGVGTSVNFLRSIFLPDRNEKNLQVPCRLPVGPRHIAPCVLSSSVGHVPVLMYLRIGSGMELTNFLPIKGFACDDFAWAICL